MLAVESLSEVVDVYGLSGSKAPLTSSRLSRGEIRGILSLRSDFIRDDLEKIFV